MHSYHSLHQDLIRIYKILLKVLASKYFVWWVLFNSLVKQGFFFSWYIYKSELWVYVLWRHLALRLELFWLEGFCTTLISGIWHSCTTCFLSKFQGERNLIVIFLSMLAEFLSSLPFTKDESFEDSKWSGSYFNFPGHRAHNFLSLNLKHIPCPHDTNHSDSSCAYLPDFWPTLCFLVPEDVLSSFCKSSCGFLKIIVFYLDFPGLFQMGELTVRICIMGSLSGGRGVCRYGSRWEEGLD